MFLRGSDNLVNIMDIILDGNSEHVGHVLKKIGLFGVFFLEHLLVLSIRRNALNRSNNQEYSIIRARLFLNYHLI